MFYIEVREGNLEMALKIIRRKIQKEDCFRIWKNNTFFESNGQKRRKKMHEISRKVSRKTRKSNVQAARYYESGSSNLPLEAIYNVDLLKSVVLQQKQDQNDHQAQVEQITQVEQTTQE